MSDEKKESRRLKRGHSEQAAKPAKAKATRQLDPQAFMEVDQMVGAFAQRSFGKVIPAVMAGFFGGAKSPKELEDPELQSAFMLFFVYGWKDPNGVRIIDAFAAYGPNLQHEQKRVLTALRASRLGLFVAQGRTEGNKQLTGRDFFRDEPVAVLDHNAYETLADGDGLIAWFMEVGGLWRPFGVATQIEARKLSPVCDALTRLAASMHMTIADLPDRKPAQAFWTVYRGVNLATPPE